MTRGEVCETIILSFNGEILKRLIESEDVYPGGYLKSINGPIIHGIFMAKDPAS